MQHSIDKKSVFDKADLMERLDNDDSLAVELAQLFVSDARGKLVLLHTAITAEDCPEIEKAAHALKGAASNISAEKVRYIAGIIETGGRNNDMGTVATAYKMLRPAIDELIDALTLQLIGPAGT